MHFSWVEDTLYSSVSHILGSGGVFSGWFICGLRSLLCGKLDGWSWLSEGLKYCHLTKSNTRLIFYDDCSSRVRDSASIYLNGDNTARSSKSEEYVFCWPHHFLLGHPEVSIIGVLCEVTQFIFDHVIGKCPNPRTTVNAVRQHISFRYIIHNK